MPPINVGGGTALDDRPWAARENRARRRRRKILGTMAAGGTRWWRVVIGGRWLRWQTSQRWVRVGSGDSGGHRPGGFGSWRLGIGYGGRPASKTGPPDDEKGGGGGEGAKMMQGQLSRLWSAHLQNGKGQVLWIGTCGVPRNVLCELRTPAVPEAETSEAGQTRNERGQRQNISHDASLFRDEGNILAMPTILFWPVGCRCSSVCEA
jgi:hypothetical protein